MKAKNIEEDGEDLIITFPSAKNDQFNEGHTIVLAANGTDFCPVQLIKLYYRRFGRQQGTELCVQRSVGGQYLCRSTASVKHKFVQTEPHITVCMGGPGSNSKDSQECEDDGHDGNVGSVSDATGSGSLAVARDGAAVQTQFVGSIFAELPEECHIKNVQVSNGADYVNYLRNGK